MTTTAQRRPIAHVPATRTRLAQTGPPHVAPTSASPPRGPGPTDLFQVPFASAMSDADVALLAGTLDLTTHMHPKLLRSPAGAGVVRLDPHSGLFLKRGVLEGHWLLEARTWGHPASCSIHEWHVLAAGAARLLDPLVAVPERLAIPSPEYPMRPPGRAANKRFARIGRRILGL